MSELLAPVGSQEALVAAVRSGADAVYLGADRFNARRNADNFDSAALREAVAYCRVRGVRVYLTLNTLVSDRETADALSTAKAAADAGVDAFILQDVGLASLIRRACPGVRLHASTQMSVHSPSALPLLAQMGFCRVVVSRECSKEEIAELCRVGRECGIEIEAFVHGAQCMCVSGQCYLSGLLGGRSGNRGLCAQPCRLEYADGTHPLSLKDMSLLSHIRQLHDMGVASFKIEGRMKRPEYVAAAVSAFRSAIDCGVIDRQSADWLGEVFSRSGHTDGYFEGKRDITIFGHRTADDAVSGGTLHAIHELYRRERQSVAVNMRLTVCIGRPTELTVSDGHHTATVSGAVPEPAKERPLTAERARELCAKLGATPYYLEKFDAETDGVATMPAGEINALRRSACQRLDEMRAAGGTPFVLPDLALPQVAHSPSPSTAARFSDVSQIPPDMRGVDTVYIPLETDFELHGGLINRLRSDGIAVAAELPRGLFGIEDRLCRLLRAAAEAGIDTALCHNIAAVRLAQSEGFKVHGGFGLNVYNSYSAAEWRRLGVGRITHSFESTLRDIADAHISDNCIIAYGRLPLMLMRACPIRAQVGCSACTGRLVDRKQAVLPVMCRFGTAELLNAEPLWLADRRREITGVDCFMLYFTDESRTDCDRILGEWRRGDKCGGSFTRGLYYRGVK